LHARTLHVYIAKKWIIFTSWHWILRGGHRSPIRMYGHALMSRLFGVGYSANINWQPSLLVLCTDAEM
jgi:hypothetical protein